MGRLESDSAVEVAEGEGEMRKASVFRMILMTWMLWQYSEIPTGPNFDLIPEWYLWEAHESKASCDANLKKKVQAYMATEKKLHY